MANKIAAVAELLGVKLQEEFTSENGLIYKFTSTGLQCYEKSLGRFAEDTPAMLMFILGQMPVIHCKTPHNAERCYYLRRRWPEGMCHDCERIDDKCVDHLAYIDGTRCRTMREAAEVKHRTMPLCILEPDWLCDKMREEGRGIDTER